MNSKKVGNFLVGVSILLLLIILYFDHQNTVNIKQKIAAVYDTEFADKVYSLSHNRGTIKLRLIKEPSKVIYFGSTRNYNYNPYRFYDFVSPGDSIYKKANSWEIMVYKNGIGYRFILNEFIGPKPMQP